MKTLWGGAFQETPDALVERFLQSIEPDRRFWQEELIGSVAHARMLGETGIITKKEASALISGLEQMHEEGPEKLSKDAEDIHTAIEIRLREICGDVTDKLAIARSRNDQVATSTRLFLHNELLVVLDLIKKFQAELLKQAKQHRNVLMPGFTHMQPAQPITLGFWFLAHFWAQQRNGWRAERLFEAANYSPLGSGAMAGTSFPIDRDMTAHELGFDGPMPNALDAVSDRSFVLDALHVCTITMASLSRLCTELIMYSAPAYGFVKLSDKVTTGSILLPQKRNPDVAELIRGRSAHAIGNWTAFASMMKGLPLGYNRDAQDDKPLLYESLDLTKDSLQLVTLMLEEATWDARALARAAGQGSSTALDLAEELTARGVSFRDAHTLVGQVVSSGKVLDETAREVKIQGAYLRLPTPRDSVRRRASKGGPGPKAMAEQIRHASKLLKRSGFPKPY
jgi:argininosuccinate lyase